ncbi:hypothetical protein QTG54_000571 [Skeletonema marinoi]|uniref:Uncharacterized protein n=2 Tax=Skeletonema marinoi TaxID=267567 RepID=A0AAD9DIM9_9STRA|nr:hypothetical protein QTG54_000571 [Skeletonema marinoi]|eukprot:scaffold17816_cov105-Skeletonema_marinoi.AAC.1
MAKMKIDVDSNSQMNSAIPKRSSGDATPKAEPSLLSSLPPPPAPVPTQQKKVQQSSQSQQQRPQPSSRAGTETISLPQVSSLSNYQPRPKTTTLTDKEKKMVKKLDELAGIVSSNVSDAIESNNLLSVDPREFMQRENRQGGSIDLFGSFITNSENQYDFFDTDPVTNTINVTPLPNSRIPIFPEDFPPNKSEWPLRWWGIHQPSEELLQLHDEKALSLGYPVSNRKGSSPGSRIQPTAEKSSRGNESKSKRESESRRRKRSGDNSGKERSRKRHADDRKHRRS